MINRSPVAVLLYSIITCGIWSLVWFVKTKGELVSLGADIPTAWLLIVPIANFYWIWKYSEGVEKVTGGKTTAALALVLLLLLGPIGSMVLQGKFNELVKA